eukprot:m.27099 g.27099  ORF g.27099 m.27099 type:complete len:540 (+) comp4372_c0_seq1:156-1775(+)
MERGHAQKLMYTCPCHTRFRSCSMITISRHPTPKLLSPFLLHSIIKNRVKGDGNNFPSPAWVSVNGHASTGGLVVGGAYTIATTSSGLSSLKVKLGSDNTDDTTHTLKFDATCPDDSAGLAVGDIVGPFQIVELSTVGCPGGTAAGCGVVECLPPQQDREDPDLTTVEPVEKQTASTGGSSSTTTARSGTSTEVVEGAAGTRDNLDVTLCFPTPTHAVQVGDTVTINNNDFVVNFVAETTQSTTCLTVTESTAGGLMSCSSPDGCDIYLHTHGAPPNQVTTVAATDATVAAGESTVVPPEGQGGGGGGGGPIFQGQEDAVCTFGLYQESNDGCSGSPDELITIKTSVGFTSQECAVINTALGGVTNDPDGSGWITPFPLYLTAQPVCKTNEAAEQEWTMCSWQPNPSSTLCNLVGQECCDYIVDYVDFIGIKSVDIACQRYRPGDCATLYSFDGTQTHKLSATLIGCEGAVPKDPQCDSALQGEPPLTYSSAKTTTIVPILAVVVLVGAVMLRQRRLSRRSQDQHVMEPLLSTTVANVY